MRTFILTILIIIIGLLCACSQKEEVTTEKQVIKIGYLPITHAAPLLYNHYVHDGSFDEYELELVKFSSWPDLIDALNAGQIDGASVLMQLAMQAKDIGIDLKAVALGHEDGNVIISAHDIEKASDLRGKTVAIPHTHSAHHLLLNELFMEESVVYDDVELIEMPPPEMPAALAEGRISSYVVAEPFGALAVHLDAGKVLAYSEDVWPNSYCCVLVLRDEFIEQDKELVTSFVASYVEAGKLADEKTDELYDALKAYLDVTDEVLDVSLAWISFDSLQIEEAEYDKLSDRILRLNLMEEVPPYEEFVDLTFIEKVSESDGS